MTRGLAAFALAVLAVSACRRIETNPTAPSASARHDGSSAPKSPDVASIRYVIGGDSREDDARVVVWALRETKARGAAAMIFLGDMELDPALDEHFRAELAELAPVPFLPVLGNHEAGRRERAKDAPREERVRALGAFAARFLGDGGAKVESAFPDKLSYSVDLPGGVHFIALDDVSQSGLGADQLAWLGADLARARLDAGVKHLVVGMHKALAGSGITRHAMDEDGPTAVADSAAALALFEQNHVELVVASHFHVFAEYTQHGIHTYITGGMGAPLDLSYGKEAAFHHVLAVTVPADGPLAVEVVRFPGPQVYAKREQR